MAKFVEIVLPGGFIGSGFSLAEATAHAETKEWRVERHEGGQRIKNTEGKSVFISSEGERYEAKSIGEAAARKWNSERDRRRSGKATATISASSSLDAAAIFAQREKFYGGEKA